MAFGRSGRTGGENAGQHSANLFRRCGVLAVFAQSRPPNWKPAAQRVAQFKAQLIQQYTASSSTWQRLFHVRKRISNDCHDSGIFRQLFRRDLVERVGSSVVIIEVEAAVLNWAESW